MVSLTSWLRVLREPHRPIKPAENDPNDSQATCYYRPYRIRRKPAHTLRPRRPTRSPCSPATRSSSKPSVRTPRSILQLDSGAAGTENQTPEQAAVAKTVLHRATAAMDRTQFEATDLTQISADDLMGTDVYSAQDEKHG